ncbi:MAG: hypothetical protein NTU49_05315 [Gammaproteobacteria bacterium]|nr:hypothetical protein [Gammaproteobacteria bacterium]
MSKMLPDAALTKVVLNADKINLNNIHLNTQTMAKTIGEMVQLKQAEDANQPVKATAWMALFQQFLTQMIQDNTSASVAGLAVSTPMGELSGEYDVSFPTLSNAHDYFDVATRNVGVLQVDVPHWMYADVTRR